MEKSFIWLTAFTLISIVSVIMVPQKRYIKLLPFGIFAGFLLSMAVMLLAVPWIRLWEFNHISSFSVYGIPLFLALTLLPTTVIFAHYAPKFHNEEKLLFWVLIFTTATTFAQGLLQQAGFVVFINWNLLAAMMLSFAIYSFLALFIINYEVAPPETVKE
ncbi:MAG: hypothetical protein GX318_02680 [Clostridia bacterium]|nr:hypothetical protein [Clostridia bacterium]